MSNAARKITVTAELEEAIEKASSAGERLELVGRDGHSIYVIEPDDDLFSTDPVDPEELKRDAEDLNQAIAEWKASGEPMVPWEEVRKRLDAEK